MKKKILSVAQLMLGIGLVALLLNNIDQSSWRIAFEVAHPVSVSQGSVYTDDAQPVPGRYTVTETADNALVLNVLKQGKLGRDFPNTGQLTREDGIGPEAISWIGAATERQGFALIATAFKVALTNGHWLALGALLFGVCLFFCIVRWNMLLKAQGLMLPFQRVMSLYFVGQFFNSFMPGSVGGDVIKAYFAARRTRQRKTEAITTIVLDRVIGLLALLAMTALIMVVFLRFFLSHRETRIALVFNIALLAAAMAGLIIVFRKNVFEHWAFFKKLSERTSFGALVNRIYNAFHLCFRHPGLLTKTILLSLGNHLSLIFCAYFLGSALEIEMPFLDYLKIFPVINAISAIPVTPGGLGTREGATVFLLGVLHVPAAAAIALSLLIYVTILGWSLIGGIVYCTYLYGADKSLRDDMRSAIEEEVDNKSSDKPLTR